MRPDIVQKVSDKSNIRVIFSNYFAVLKDIFGSIIDFG